MLGIKKFAVTTSAVIIVYGIAISFGIGVGSMLSGCPKPTPDPVYPENVDAPVIDAPPADCAKFAGQYSVSERPMSGSQSCSKASRAIIHIEIPGGRDPDSGEWDTVVFSDSGPQMIGVIKQVETRPYICRLVVGYDGPQSGLMVINRDIYLGEQEGIGVGESIMRSADCLWQDTSVITRVP